MNYYQQTERPHNLPTELGIPILLGICITPNRLYLQRNHSSQKIRSTESELISQLGDTPVTLSRRDLGFGKNAGVGQVRIIRMPKRMGAHLQKKSTRCLRRYTIHADDTTLQSGTSGRMSNISAPEPKKIVGLEPVVDKGTREQQAFLRSLDGPRPITMGYAPFRRYEKSQSGCTHKIFFVNNRVFQGRLLCADADGTLFCPATGCTHYFKPTDVGKLIKHIVRGHHQNFWGRCIFFSENPDIVPPSLECPKCGARYQEEQAQGLWQCVKHKHVDYPQLWVPPSMEASVIRYVSKIAEARGIPIRSNPTQNASEEDGHVEERLGPDTSGDGAIESQADQSSDSVKNGIVMLKLMRELRSGLQNVNQLIAAMIKEERSGVQ